MRKLGITKRKHGLRPFVRMKLRNNTQKEYYKVVQRSKETPFETAIKVKSESKLISHRIGDVVIPTPHTHLGYMHDGKTRSLSVREQKTLDTILRVWDIRKCKD